MRARWGAYLLSCMMLSVVLSGVPSARAEVDIGIGDFWEYGAETSIEGIETSLTVKYEVADTTTSGGEELFVLDISGNGELSSVLEGVEMSGSVDLSGYQHRRLANYDLWAQCLIISMDVSGFGMTMEMNIGTETVTDRGMDDYIGDDNLTLGSVVSSSTFVEGETWVDILGMNESEPMMDYQTITMTVVAEGVEVSVPAGTFDCVEVEVVVSSGLTDELTEYWYYSAEVRNYVKLEGSELLGLGATTMELTDYSSGKGGIISSLLGENLWVLFIIMAVVVILVMILVVKRQVKKNGPYEPGQVGPEAVYTPPVQPSTPQEFPAPPPPEQPPPQP